MKPRAAFGQLLTINRTTRVGSYSAKAAVRAPLAQRQQCSWLPRSVASDGWIDELHI